MIASDFAIGRLELDDKGRVDGQLCGFFGGSLCASSGHSLSTIACISSEMWSMCSISSRYTVRQHQRFGHAFRCVGEETKRASAVTALALRTGWHRAIGPNYDTLV
jgi:hypothetical protein